MTEFDFSNRRLDLLSFLRQHEAVPIGLSWFQSTWDPYCRHVMHQQLNMRCPEYEYVHPKESLKPQVKHPFAAPFNVYLDHFRDPKELAQEVLLKRLEKVNPFDYSQEFVQDPLPNAYGEIRDIQPTWRQSTVWKERNRLSHFRGLRPASAKVPLNNNPDLEYPLWPPPRSHYILNKYPRNVRRLTPHRDSKWALPPNEHPQQRIDHTQDIHEINRQDAQAKD